MSNSSETTKRLDAILRLILDYQRERNKEIAIGDQILVLMDSGLAQGEAGKVLGIDSNQVPGYLRSVKNRALFDKLKAKKKPKSKKSK